MTFGERFKQIRTEELKKTQREMATMIGCSQSQVSDIERGRYRNVRVTTAVGVARVLKSSLDDVVAGIDPEFDRIRRDLLGHSQALQRRQPNQEGAADVPASARVLKPRESSYAQALDEIHKRSAEILVLIERVRPDSKTRTTAHHSASRRGGR